MSGSRPETKTPQKKFTNMQKAPDTMHNKNSLSAWKLPAIEEALYFPN